MKRSFRGFIVVWILPLFLCAYATARQDTEITLVKQPFAQSTSPDNFILRFSSGSISAFLKNVFNLSRYPQEHLARNYSHVIQGINLANKHPHPRKFITKVLRLFSLKLHDLYINPYAFRAFLEKLIETAAPYADQNNEKEQLVRMFVETIGGCLSEQFDQLRSEPEKTLNQLAHILYELSQHGENQDIPVRELQHTIHYFLTRSINLLVWSPLDQEDAWQVMIAIAGRIEYCVSHNLLDIEMADDLYWLLLNQFCIFLSVAASELSSSFFEAASRTLNSTGNGFWLCEERELYITSKYEHLKNALMQAEATSKLHAIGYLTA